MSSIPSPTPVSATPGSPYSAQHEVLSRPTDIATPAHPNTLLGGELNVVLDRVQTLSTSGVTDYPSVSEVESSVPPPSYQEDLKLVPMTVEQSARYDRGLSP